ncbi:MAG: hypothetical protein SPJ13_04135 [Bacteroidales bacterium]|nr:hypothetical protein [Bacteroidales bacterium]
MISASSAPASRAWKRICTPEGCKRRRSAPLGHNGKQAGGGERHASTSIA